MATPEEVLEALLVEAELSEEVREKLLSPEDRSRLEAAGFEVWQSAWGDPVAKAPYEEAYKPAEAQVAVLDAIGEEGAAALEAAWRLGQGERGRERVLGMRAEMLAAAGAGQEDGGDGD